MPRLGAVAMDCETTGIDHWHGARPWMVQAKAEGWKRPRYWRWPVDPLTRQVRMPDADRRELGALIRAADELVLHNAKFDAVALTLAGVVEDWPWEKTHCTLIMAHLLASNVRHDLTSTVIQWLDEDIGPLEEALKATANEARRLCRTRRFVESHGEWRLAEEGLPEMPSAKSGSKRDEKGLESERPWKFDSWLPGVVAELLGYPEGHPWRTVAEDYACADVEVLLPLWRVMRTECERRGHWPLYAEKVKNLPVLVEMERRGTTVLEAELEAVDREYAGEIEFSNARCCDIAGGWHYDLKLPKSGNNGSLRTFCFGDGNGNRYLDLPVLKRTDTGMPSFDKDVIEEYKRTLDGDQLSFVRHLSAGRKRAKSREFFAAYRVFGIPAPGELLVLHPSVNPTATATTRLSMSNPNLQQVSKQETLCEECLGEGCEACGGSGEDLHSVRRIFGPGPGQEWWSMDAANIELRLPAFESGERSLIDLFERPDDPPFWGSQHLLNFSIVYPDMWGEELRAVGFDKVGPRIKKKYAGDWYRFCKNGGLGMQYRSGRETADRTFRRPGSFDRLRSHFIALESLNNKWVRFAEKHGWVETMPDRSICPEHGYPLLCSRGDSGWIVSTTPLSYHVQGTAGWWMVRAMNRCHEQLKRWRTCGFDGFIALTVHDELVFDFPKAAPDAMGQPGNLWRARVLQRLMERGGDDIGVPTPVSVELHERSWAEGRTF